jgi:hypothetical protein
LPTLIIDYLAFGVTGNLLDLGISKLKKPLYQKKKKLKKPNKQDLSED